LYNGSRVEFGQGAVAESGDIAVPARDGKPPRTIPSAAISRIESLDGNNVWRRPATDAVEPVAAHQGPPVRVLASRAPEDGDSAAEAEQAMTATVDDLQSRRATLRARIAAAQTELRRLNVGLSGMSPKSSTTEPDSDVPATDASSGEEPLGLANAMAEKPLGRNDGRIVSDTVIAHLAGRLARQGVRIDQGDDAQRLLIIHHAVGIFIAEEDKKTARICLKPDATRFEIAHELMHMKEWLKDPGAYVERGLAYKKARSEAEEKYLRAESRVAAEEYVYNALRTTQWHRLTAAERKRSDKYIRDVRRDLQFKKKGVK